MTSHCNLFILNLSEHSSYYPKFFKKIYDKNCQKKKNIYINWIDDISKKNKTNIYWWSLSHINKNNYLNNIFHYFVLIETLDSLKDSKKFNTIIVDDILKDNIKKIKFKFKKKIIFKKLSRRQNFFQIFKFLIYEFFSILILKLYKKNNYQSRKLILIDCFITDYENYETYIMKKLKKNFGENKSIFVPTFSYLNYLKRFFLNIKLINNKNYLIKEHYLHLSDLISFFKILKYAYLYEKKINQIKKWDFDKIIKNEMRNFTQFENIFISILNYLFFKRLKDKSFNLLKSINYFENQNIDKGWNLGCSTFYNKQFAYGYQAFNYLPEAFNIYPSKLEFEIGACPQTLYLKGEGFKNLITENCKKINLIISSSFKKFKNIKFFKKKIDYLFIFTGVPSEDEELFKTIISFRANNPNYKIGLKYHPISNISIKLKKKLESINILIFKGNIINCLRASKFIITTGLTTSIIEGLIYDNKIIILSSKIYDKIFFEKLEIPKKSFIFLDNLNNINKLKLSKLNNLQKKKLIKKFF